MGSRLFFKFLLLLRVSSSRNATNFAWFHSHLMQKLSDAFFSSFYTCKLLNTITGLLYRTGGLFLKCSSRGFDTLPESLVGVSSAFFLLRPSLPKAYLLKTLVQAFRERPTYSEISSCNSLCFSNIA